MVCQVFHMGNAILRKPTSMVENFTDATIKSIRQDLEDTLQASGGVGIAAPQIGVSLRIIIIASRPNHRYPHAPEIKPITMFNPEIISYSDTIEKGWEGCLSIPGIRGQVPRSKHIQIRYIDANTFNQRDEVYEDFVARIIQHEIDHLNTTLFVDRLESTRDLATEHEYQKYIAEYLHSGSNRTNKE